MVLHLLVRLHIALFYDAAMSKKKKKNESIFRGEPPRVVASPFLVVLQNKFKVNKVVCN